jgi:hypothetical protein
MEKTVDIIAKLLITDQDVESGIYTKEEQETTNKAIQKAINACAIIVQLHESLPELNDEHTPLDGSKAVDVLCGVWDDVKNCID